MITREEYLRARRDAAEAIRKSGIVISDEEVEKMDVADFGLSRLSVEGAQIVELVGTDKIAMRVIYLKPGQTEPEHWHIGFDGYEGKQETIRVISGELYLYLAGDDNICAGKIPEGQEQYYTSRNEHVMHAADTLTMPPLQKHWFQAGSEGCVFYTCSTLAVDAKDPFTNPNIVRKTVIQDEKERENETT